MYLCKSALAYFCLFPLLACTCCVFVIVSACLCVHGMYISIYTCMYVCSSDLVTPQGFAPWGVNRENGWVCVLSFWICLCVLVPVRSSQCLMAQQKSVSISNLESKKCCVTFNCLWTRRTANEAPSVTYSHMQCVTFTKPRQ